MERVEGKYSLPIPVTIPFLVQSEKEELQSGAEVIQGVGKHTVAESQDLQIYITRAQDDLNEHSSLLNELSTLLQDEAISGHCVVLTPLLKELTQCLGARLGMNGFESSKVREARRNLHEELWVVQDDLLETTIP